MLDNQKFGKRLVQAGVISQAQLDDALRQQQVQEGRLGEILVRLGYVSESTVLQFLAAEFRTRYVSTERLAKARIPQQVLDLLPVHIAERYNLIPVLFDSENSTLSIVTSDPQNEASLREVHMITRVRELRVYVALQSAVQAAIRKHYRGEVNAFSQVQQSGYNYETGDKGQGEYGYGNENSDATMYVAPGVGGHGTSDYNPASQIYTPSGGNVAYSDQDLPYSTPSHYDQNAYPGQPASFETPPPNTNYNYDQQNYNYSQQQQPQAAIEANYSYSDAYSDEYDDDVTRLHVGPFVGYNNNDPAYQVDSASTEIGSIPRPSLFGGVEFIPLLRMIAESVEKGRERYKEHLSSQESLLRMILKRLDLPKAEADCIWAAFFLHHIELPLPHPCLLSLARDDSLMKKTREGHQAFLQRVKRFQLPASTMEILTHMYERFDGEGFPNSLAGDAIPKGARLIALLDTYEDLRYEEPNVEAEEVLERLRNHEGKLFDGELLDLFEKEVLRIEKYLKGDISRVLLFDPDESFTSELEHLLLSRGFWVQIAQDHDQAHQVCKENNLDLVVLEVDLSGDPDGFAFVKQIKEAVSEPPEFLFVTSDDGAEKIEEGMALARDYLIKPMSPNVVVAKINRHMQQIQQEKKRREGSNRSRRGIAGSLEELALPDLLQVLSQGRRSGQLTIHAKETGYVYLDQGSVINAICGSLKGEQAFYKMIGWEKGEFSLDPEVSHEERLINAPLDGLILDGLRMLDENRRDGIEDPFSEFDDFGDFGEEDGFGAAEDEFDFSGLNGDDETSDTKDGHSAKKAQAPTPESGGIGELLPGDFNENEINNWSDEEIDLDSVFNANFSSKKS